MSFSWLIQAENRVCPLQAERREGEAMSTNGKRPATKTTRTRARSKREPPSDPAISYDEFKDFEGRKYTGMKIGRSHKWYYDPGEWKEKKITPDLWQISYAVTKRRAGKAP